MNGGVGQSSKDNVAQMVVQVVVKISFSALVGRGRLKAPGLWAG